MSYSQYNTEEIFQTLNLVSNSRGSLKSEEKVKTLNLKTQIFGLGNNDLKKKVSITIPEGKHIEAIKVFKLAWLLLYLLIPRY